MKKAAWLVAMPGALLLTFLAACGILNLALGHHPMPGRPLGNLPPKYRVAVLGDAQKGLANLANLLEAIKKENVSIVLQTGDLVSDNDEGHYRLVALYLQRAALPVPLVVVPGNHDLKRDPARFQRELGPLERSFRLGQVAFVTLNNALGDPPDPRRVEAQIAAAPPHEALILAMHVPPFDVNGQPFPEYAPFLEWLARSRVAYLLCGHVHGYFRKKVGETTVLVNGVGGDYDKWQLYQKVYATILEVDGTSITDRAVEILPSHGLVANLEHLAIGHVAEAYRKRPLACWAGTVLLAALTGFTVGCARLRKTA